MPFGLTADEPAVHIEKAVDPSELADDRSPASEPDTPDHVRERVDIQSDVSDPELLHEGEHHSPIDLSSVDSASSDKVETDKDKAKDDKTKRDILPPPPEELTRVLEPGLVSYSKAPTSKAKCCICIDRIKRGWGAWNTDTVWRRATAKRVVSTVIVPM